jgi:two-component system response regulator MtrA
VLRIGDLTIDVDAHEVRRGSAPIADALEFQLLVALASKPQQVFSREMLEQVLPLQGRHPPRERARAAPCAQGRARSRQPGIVTTVRGVGYRAGSVV